MLDPLQLLILGLLGASVLHHARKVRRGRTIRRIWADAGPFHRMQGGRYPKVLEEQAIQTILALGDHQGTLHHQGTRVPFQIAVDAVERGRAPAVFARIHAPGTGILLRWHLQEAGGSLSVGYEWASSGGIEPGDTSLGWMLLDSVIHETDRRLKEVAQSTAGWGSSISETRTYMDISISRAVRAVLDKMGTTVSLFDSRGTLVVQYSCAFTRVKETLLEGAILVGVNSAQPRQLIFRWLFSDSFDRMDLVLDCHSPATVDFDSPTSIERQIFRSILDRTERELRSAGAHPVNTHNSSIAANTYAGISVWQATLCAAEVAYRGGTIYSQDGTSCYFYCASQSLSFENGLVKAVVRYRSKPPVSHDNREEEFTSDCLPPAVHHQLILEWHFLDIPDQAVSLSLNITGEETRHGQPSFSGLILDELIRRTHQQLIDAGAVTVERWLAADICLLRRFWPSPQDYNEAIQNPSQVLSDAELQEGSLALNLLGLPCVATGAFASVYQLSCPGADYAVRCFNMPVKDHSARYHAIGNFIAETALPHLVSFWYIEEGIKVRQAWFPLLKMQWVEGTPLHIYIEQALGKADVLLNLRNDFASMVGQLVLHGAAHGDLQHGNILVRGGSCVLVDYDGMYVPGLAGMTANEVGHPNYQHPARSNTHFGPDLDSFSAWVIDSALLCLAMEPGLWDRFGGGDDSLLFRRADYLAPEESALFYTLLHHQSAEVRKRANFLLQLIGLPLENLPKLEVIGA